MCAEPSRPRCPSPLARLAPHRRTRCAAQRSRHDRGGGRGARRRRAAPPTAPAPPGKTRWRTPASRSASRQAGRRAGGSHSVHGRSGRMGSRQAGAAGGQPGEQGARLWWRQAQTSPTRHSVAAPSSSGSTSAHSSSAGREEEGRGTEGGPIRGQQPSAQGGGVWPSSTRACRPTTAHAPPRTATTCHHRPARPAHLHPARMPWPAAS